MFKYQNDNTFPWACSNIILTIAWNLKFTKSLQKKRSETHKHMTWHLFFKVAKSV